MENKTNDEAAELYAGQTKKEETVSGDVENQISQLFDNARSQSCVDTGGGFRDYDWNFDLDNLKNKAIELFKQSQQQSANTELEKQNEELVKFVEFVFNTMPTGSTMEKAAGRLLDKFGYTT